MGKSKVDLKVMEEVKLVLEMVKQKKRVDLIARQLRNCSLDAFLLVMDHLEELNKPVKPKKTKGTKDEE